MSRPSTTTPVPDQQVTEQQVTEPQVTEPQGAEEPFTGTLADLDRLARVAVGTVVVVFTGDRTPTLRQPGDLLVPRLSPLGRRVTTLPVTVLPVSLSVSVDGLGTSDGEVLEHVEVRVRVRFDPADDHAVVRRLATEHGPSFGDSLMQDVLHGVETAVRAAVGLNRSGDLRRQSLADLLTDHWMPSRLAADTLLVESLTVPSLDWPSPPDPDLDSTGDTDNTEDTDSTDDTDSTEDTVEIARAELAGPSVVRDRLLLSDDARLRRRWERRSEVQLQAVSTGRTTGARTAILTLGSPTDFEVARRVAHELVADDDTLDAALVVEGATYADVVASWFEAVAHDGSRFVSVDLDDDLSRLTVHLAPTRRPATHDVPFDPHDPAVDALRQLLPFDLVVFEGLE